MRSARLLLATTLLCTLPCAAQEAPRLGRLFMTPAMRQDIDARWRERAAESPVATPDASASQVADAPAPVTRLDGVVRRSAGPATVWLNGVPHQVLTGQAVGDVPDTRLDGEAVLLRDASGRQHRLRPGESVERP
jgi:hypothetical protein